MSKAVAGEVKATPSSQKHPADINQTGAWQLVGKEITVPYPKLKTEKGPVLQGASANFMYSGGSVPAGPASAPLPPIPSMVKLDPKPTKLKTPQKPVLVEGDTLKDAFGNELAVSVVSAKMTTK